MKSSKNKKWLVMKFILKIMAGVSNPNPRQWEKQIKDG
jgi:hypothetical protein